MNETLNIAAVQFKSRSMTIATLSINNTNLTALNSSIGEQIEQAPNLLRNAPVIIDLKQIKEDFDIQELRKICESYKIFPIGVQNCSANMEKQCQQYGIPMLRAPEKTKKIAHDIEPEKIIHRTVRSGQQIYSAGPVTVIGDVSAGAEVMSDSSVHIYGSLRGKALAGVRGNKESHIFCLRCQPELVAIATYYLVADESPELMQTSASRMSLIDNKICVLPLL